MTPETVMDLAHQGMRMALMLATPLLLTALLVGLLVSLFQAATQINEMTLSFIPKILAVVLILVLSGPFLIGALVDFTTELIRGIPMMLR